MEPAEAGAGDLQGQWSPLPTVRGRLGRRCLPFPGEGRPSSWGQPRSLDSLSSGHQSPVITDREQLRTRRPFYGWEGRAAWTQPPPEGCGHPARSTPGEAETPGGRGCSGVHSWERRQGWEEGRSHWRRGSARPGSQAPREASLTASKAGLAHLQQAPRARRLPDSPRQSRRAPHALPASGGGAGCGSRRAGDRVTGLSGPSAWLGTGRSQGGWTGGGRN